MANPCIKAPLSYVDGKLGISINDEKMEVDESDQLSMHPYIHSSAIYPVNIGAQTEVGDLAAYSLPFLDPADSVVLQSGRFGPFRNRDPYHPMLMRVNWRGEIVMRQIHEYYTDVPNGLFVTGSNTILVECRIEIPDIDDDWHTLGRATASTLQPEASCQWFSHVQPVDYLTARTGFFTFGWRVRFIHSSGGFPSGVTYGCIEAQNDGLSLRTNFEVHGFPIDSWETG